MKKILSLHLLSHSQREKTESHFSLCAVIDTIGIKVDAKNLTLFSLHALPIPLFKTQISY